MSVTLQDLSLFRGKRQILQDVSFTLHDGTLTVLLGKNGCGKSTLISALAGALPFRGSVRIHDRELNSLTAIERARLISVVPQLPKRVDATVEELVAFGRLPHHSLGDKLDDADRKAIDDAITALGLQHLRAAKANRISGGELRRAYLAMALAQSTPIILLDEPTAYADEENKEKILRMLVSLTQDHGKTVLAVMHDIADAIAYADHLLLMRNGALAAQGSTEEILAGKHIESVFGLTRTVGEIWKWKA